MISLERTKELMDQVDMADQAATEVRDMARALAEIIFNDWQSKLINKSNNQKVYAVHSKTF